MRHRLSLRGGVALLSLALTAGLGLGLAAPASAVGTSPATVWLLSGSGCSARGIFPSDSAAQAQVTSISGAAGTDALTLAVSFNDAPGCDYFRVKFFDSSYTEISTSAPADSITSSSTVVPIGTTWLSFEYNMSGTWSPVFLAYKSFVDTGSSGGSSGEVAAAPVSVPIEMTLALGSGGADGVVCKPGTNASGTSGSWMTLPGSGDCSLPSRPGAVLLGWATSADFPVAIAQRQADNGWGAYELTDADGQVTAIFIPAGWGTFVSAANSLYPIWSK